MPSDKLGLRLVKSLERYKERWNQKELAELARQLREFADSLEKSPSGSKKKAKDCTCISDINRSVMGSSENSSCTMEGENTPLIC